MKCNIPNSTRTGDFPIKLALLEDLRFIDFNGNKLLGFEILYPFVSHAQLIRIQLLTISIFPCACLEYLPGFIPQRVAELKELFRAHVNGTELDEKFRESKPGDGELDLDDGSIVYEAPLRYRKTSKTAETCIGPGRFI